MTTRQIVIAFAVLVLIGVVVGLARDTKPTPPVVVTPPSPQETKFCYYYSEKTPSGLYDRAWIRIKGTTDSKVTGEFNNYPAEKDSKIGTFAGSEYREGEDGVGEYLVIWDILAEGMRAKEELFISNSNEFAAAAFGEMVQGSNGVYVYKDKTKVTYQTPLPQIDCAQLDEIVAVETYLKTADIEVITKEKPVLGGKWYMTSVVANPATDTANISYEDGHIAGKGTLTYTFDNGKVTVVSFTKSK